MIDLIELTANLFESFEKHFFPFMSKKMKLLKYKFEQDFYKKMLLMHLEENKKIYEKIKTQEAIKTAFEKKGNYDTDEQSKEIKRLQDELHENNLKVEALKGKIKND